VAEPVSRDVPRRAESRRHFKARVDAALNDEALQANMIKVMTALRERRQQGFESWDFESGRQDLKRRRLDNLQQLPALLTQFRERLEEVGGTFHLARDAEEARQIIGDICKRAGAGIVTKSKSMATEEILLNPYLESLGMEVVETDLGERAVQLLHEHPSHLIAPAIHVTLDQWAKLFDAPPDPAQIQAKVREQLRQKFIDASVGISGANFAIAETGTIGLVTNEGNADLTVTLPKVHIALFGIDKVVASLDDAVAILRMLPRSGTGQRISTYVNWITGPSRSADIGFSLTIGAHGPKEMHCVVLDNGREQMRSDPLFKGALTCVRCGACSNACPPFMAVTGHQFGHIYNGPIGLVLTPFHHGMAAVDLPQSLCTQCNACQEICPVDIELPRMILEHRRHSKKKSLAKRGLLTLWPRPRLAQLAMDIGAPISPQLASPPLRRRLKSGGDGEAVTLFASCLVDRMMPEAGQALERIVRAAGCHIEFPKAQWCCGLMPANAGQFEAGVKLNSGLIRALKDSRGTIVTPSASCFGAMTIDAKEWGQTDPDLAGVANRMRDSTRFVLELLERGQLTPSPQGGEGRGGAGGADRIRVAYHDSCQSLRQLGLRAEPRRVLELAGYEPVDLPDIANCCGFGGTFSVDWPQVADRLIDWKLDAIAKTGCTVVVSDNPGCLMHIRGAAERRHLDLRSAHVLELVAERLPA
jgi:L-lactate dehydrogenase complex protein LldF